MILFRICLFSSICFAFCLNGRSCLVFGQDEEVAVVADSSGFPYPIQYVQGEYQGSMIVDGVARLFGLQVVARGEGRFTAGLLWGGLPSAILLNPHSTKLEGTIANDKLVLRSEGGLAFDFRGEPNYRFVQLDHRGQVMSTFQRVDRYSLTLGQAPPPGARVLFRDGQIGELSNAKLTPEGLLAIGATTAFPVNDFQLHVEFRLPLQAEKSNQNRGNSGIYIQRRYEVQILDSFGELPSNNNAASLYRQRAAAGNMSLPPTAWQTYDIWFRAARWSADGKKLQSARVTVAHNGVVVHRNVEITDKTGAGWQEGPEPHPILFQDHSDPVEFQNLWLVESK